MKVLGISGDEQRAFWLVLGAIYHLGAAGATKGKIARSVGFIASSLIRMDNVNHNITHTSDKEHDETAGMARNYSCEQKSFQYHVL